MTMSFDDVNSIYDLEDLDFVGDNLISNVNGSYSSQLCVPQDPIETLQWYPSFSNDPISLADLDDVFDMNPKTHKNLSANDRALPDFDFDFDINPKVFSTKERGIRRLNLKQRNERKGETGRKCSHCLTSKTPQWRVGPQGPKTLCNACGVRYKTGRLLPEYRPAASPTFDSHVHSNFHRQIMKKRKGEFS